MKKLLIKCSDERNRMFSIITTIAEASGKKIVMKEAVYPEGAAHLKDMQRFGKMLNDTYAPVKVCPAVLRDGILYFDFIKGESLEERYLEAFKAEDRDTFRRLLLQHKEILTSNKKNRIEFTDSCSFRDWFGDSAPYMGQAGFAVSNFDAIAGNIIFTGEDTVFIDYEWVMDFPMPQDLVIFHCIRDIYYHIPNLEDFFPLTDAAKFLGIETDPEILQKSYEHFFNYVISEKDGRSFAAIKRAALKNCVQADSILKDNEQLGKELKRVTEEWKSSAETASFTGRMWQQTDQALNEIQRKNQQLVKKLGEHEADLKRQEETLNDRYNHLKIDTDRAYADLMAEYQKLNQDRDIWKSRYEEVISTKSYRAAQKARKVFRKK
ncbi:MAG TPA: hypothetical protein PLN48_05280 [Lachnospiraceae bacterium]|nr:hypothetical protein [Lachnospiraceae bacterium]